MTRIWLHSSSLATVLYEPRQHRLQVTFRTGAVYHYSNVPPQLYEEFLAAESKGLFFNQRIRGQFPYERGLSTEN